MRDIKFRGKDSYGRWIYGSQISLDANSGYVYICEPYEQASTLTPMQLIHMGTHSVDASTVGEFTGIYDKNGKPIYEGDIVLTQPYLTRPHSAHAKGKKFIGVVEKKSYVFENRLYGKQIYNSQWKITIREDMGSYRYSSWSDFWQCEVIGNIHDNPELVKKEQEV